MDWDKIERNLSRMVEGGASDAEMEAYLVDEGTSTREYMEVMLQGLRDDRVVPEGASDMGHVVGSANTGTAAALGLPVDAVTGALNAGIYGINQLGTGIPYIEDPVGGSEFFRSVLDEGSRASMEGTNAIGLTNVNVPDRVSEVQAVTPFGRVGGAMAEEGAAMMTGMGMAAPLASAPGLLGRVGQAMIEQPGMQLATSAGAGAGVGLMNEAGVEGLPADFIGGTAGGVAGYGLLGKGTNLLMDYFVRPFTRSGQERLAGHTIREASQVPAGEFAPSIEGGMAQRTTPGVEPITAAVTPDVGMATLTRGLVNDPSTGMAQRLTERQGANDDAYRGALAEVGGEVAPEVAGRTLRGVYDEQYSRMQGAVSRAYDAIDPDGTSAIPVEGIWDVMADVTQRRFADRTAGTPEAVQAIMGRFGPRATMTFNQLDTIQKELADLSASYRNQGQNNLAGAVDEMRSAVMGAIDGALPTEARSLRRAQGELYEEGIGGLFERNRFGSAETPDSAIPGAISRTGYEGGEQFGRTLGQDPEGRQALVDFLVTEATSGARSGADGRLRAGSFRTFIDRLNPLMRGLVDTGTIEPEHFELLQNVAREMTRDTTALRGGSAIGSPTAQNLSIAGLISRATGGVVGEGTLLGGATANSVDRLAGLIYKVPEREIKELLVQAMLDPTLAVALAGRATPHNLAQFENLLARRLQVSVGTLLGTGATQSAAEAP